MFIENPNKEFSLNEFPEIRRNSSLEDIKTSVLYMDQVIKKKEAENLEEFFFQI